MQIFRHLTLVFISSFCISCTDKISDKAKYELTHIVFKDSIEAVKSKILELETLLAKMPKTQLGYTSYRIEKLDVRYNTFNFNDVERGKLKDLDSLKAFQNLSEMETRKFVSLIKFLDENGLNGATLDNGAFFLNYRDSITIPTNWTERVLILKRNNEATKTGLTFDLK